MIQLIHFYQYIPEKINPVAVTVGFFSVRWYAIMYLIAFGVVYFILSHQAKINPAPTSFRSGHSGCGVNKKSKNNISSDLIVDFLIYAIVGLLIGARLGYVLFYNLPYYLNHPLESFLPVQIINSGFQFTGFYGMSHYGGAIGVIIVALLFARKNKLSFWHLADFVVPAIPAGYFFGRIGNFINGELYGRVTNKFWGMYFPSDLNKNLRHPSQLYEAFFEGVVLFIILWIFRKKSLFPGFLLTVYLFGYGFFRFFIEFFREPDPQIGLLFNFLTLGQILSIFLMLVSGGIYFWKRKGKMV